MRFWPHVLTDVEEVGTRTTVLGTGIATPMLVAPLNRQRDIRPLGEVETARGAAAAGSLLAVSTYRAGPSAPVGTGRADSASCWLRPIGAAVTGAAPSEVQDVRREPRTGVGAGGGDVEHGDHDQAGDHRDCSCPIPGRGC